MKRSALAAVRFGVRFCGVLRAMWAELVRLNRFAVEGVPNAARSERARMVAAELTRRYRSPNRCC
jgi:hypothetical protein